MRKEKGRNCDEDQGQHARELTVLRMTDCMRVCTVFRVPDGTNVYDAQQVSVVSVVGIFMNKPGVVARASSALARSHINILAMQQTPDQLTVNFVVFRSDYVRAMRVLHQDMIMMDQHQLHGQGQNPCRGRCR